MTGLDLLHKELADRGFSKAQINSKIVPAVLDILANAGTEYTDLTALRQEHDDILRYNNSLAADIRDKQRQINSLMSTVSKLEETVYNAIDEEIREQREYLEKVMKALTEGETPEARDALRRAQMFVNSVNVNSKYDNTAFIIGLATILSDGNLTAIDELKKMNPKLFNIAPAKERILV